METFFKINKNMQNMYFKLAAILNKYSMLDLKNGVEGLKYKWSARKSKHSRW